MGKRLTEEQIEKICDYADFGWWGTKIAKVMNIPSATVNYQMLRHGYDPWRAELRCKNRTPLGHAFTAAEDERILELARKDRLSPEKIAAIINRPRTSVRIRLLTLEVRAEKALEAA